MPGILGGDWPQRRCSQVLQRLGRFQADHSAFVQYLDSGGRFPAHGRTLFQRVGGTGRAQRLESGEHGVAGQRADAIRVIGQNQRHVHVEVGAVVLVQGGAGSASAGEDLAVGRRNEPDLLVRADLIFQHAFLTTVVGYRAAADDLLQVEFHVRMHHGDEGLAHRAGTHC